MKTLIRLGRCPGWSESSLGAQSFCWFCHEAAQMWLRTCCMYCNDPKFLDRQAQVNTVDTDCYFWTHYFMVKQLYSNFGVITANFWMSEFFGFLRYNHTLWLSLSRLITDANYRNDPKFSDTQNICCNHSKVWTMWLYHRLRSPNCRSSLIWVCTVCPGLSVRKLRSITVPSFLL